MTRKIINLDKLFEARRFLDEIDKLDLTNCRVVEGEKMWIPDIKKVKDFKFTGLSNCDYFLFNYENLQLLDVPNNSENGD